MDIIKNKSLLLNFLHADKRLATSIYLIEPDKIISIKESRLNEKDNNYWYTLNESNIDDLRKYKVNSFILTGPVGYYEIPIVVLNKFLSKYKEKPSDGKYHFYIYPEKHILYRNKDNQVDISKYFNELPDDLLNESKIESKRIMPEKKRNYFVLWTNEASIDDLTKGNLKKTFWHTGNYNSYKDTNIGDIVFFVQKGEASKVNWQIGLSGICVIRKIRKDIEGRQTSSGIDYFDVQLEPLLILPKTLEKTSFEKYPNTHDIVHIARIGKNDPNQTNWRIPLEFAKNLVGALINIFPEEKTKINEIFGAQFANDTLVKFDEGDGLDKGDKPLHLKPNPVEKEPRNLIMYGAPGTGKSYKLNKISTSLFPNEWLRTRITFHPNYSYRNFVGSYKPKPLYKISETTIYSSDAVTENKSHQKEPFIEYQFEAGPFLELYVKAVKYPEYNFVLIIEEINRANTAAVFGDIFQLLDRNENGESEYAITLEPSALDYLKSNNINTSTIKIPSNLYLWATMNSADQGVMPLDSAFKRRWSFEHLGLNKEQDELKDIFINIPYLGNENKKLRWNEFRSTVNNKLLSEGIHEDKLIGPFFLNKTEIAEPNSVKNKLLLYLKEDVLRYKSGLFNSELRTFSEIAAAFEKKENVFANDLDFNTEQI